MIVKIMIIAIPAAMNMATSFPLPMPVCSTMRVTMMLFFQVRLYPLR